MEQMNMQGMEVINFNFEDTSLPGPVRELRPAVYKQGDGYCVILGPDLQHGISGCGNTPQAALENWNKHLQERIKTADAGDDLLLQEIIDYLNTKRANVW